MGEMGTYTEWKLGEDPIGGMMDMRGRVPDEVPAHWLVYFAVEDTDATIEKVKELGGGVAFGPIDIPAGRFAVLTDPHGASFAVIALSDGWEAERSVGRVGGRRPPRRGRRSRPRPPIRRAGRGWRS